MKFYRTKTAIKFFPGRVLGLSAEQAQGRIQAKQIKALEEEGKFEILTEVSFKTGEVIGIEGDVSDLTASTRRVVPKLTLVGEEKKSK